MLDDTIQDLKVRLEPSELDAASLRTLLDRRDENLNEHHRQYDELNLIKTKLQCKFNGMHAELKGQESNLNSTQETLEFLAGGVNEALSKVEDHKLFKESVISLYRILTKIHKVKSLEVKTNQIVDKDGQEVANLKNKITKARSIGEKDHTSHEIDHTRLIKQNVFLTRVRWRYEPRPKP